MAICRTLRCDWVSSPANTGASVDDLRKSPSNDGWAEIIERNLNPEAAAKKKV